MINMRSLPLCVLAGAFLCPVASLAQQVAPAVRILNPVDNSNRITLTHTVSPLANAANDRGAAPDGMLLDRLQLVLQRSPAQETALRQLIAQQNTPGSHSYHQWLTPTQFGAQFGASDQDIATVESWLGSQGFSVTKVNPGKGTVEFSGSVGQLRDTFHTQIHRYAVNGETHYANANDPQIPAALAPVIAGFTSLNNFRPRPYLHKLGEASFNPTTHQVTPSWTQGNGSGGVYFVLAPSDFAKQYDLTPLYTASINGSGQTVAIVNDSNINIDLVNQFRTLFGLSANPPQVIIDGNDPGVDGINNPDGPNGDSPEAYLDVEWAGAVAPSATIDLVIAADTSIQSGLVLAMEHAVYANVAPVVSLSFGNCESGLGAFNAFIEGLWEQAAAQGQTVMASSGDSGVAGCDDSNSQEYAVGGQAVNGFASTPYNIAVGGTDFYYSQYNAGSTALNTQLGTYWSTTASQLPALSLLQYIPEQPWNDSQYGLNAFNEYTTYGTTNITGGGGGASNAAICSSTYNTSTSACNGTLSGYPKPSWQTGAGVPADGVRDLPDVSLFAANGSNYSFYPICATDADCQSPTGSNLVQIYGVGGTSASSPAFAGIMALVNQKTGQRQGQAANILYALKTQYPSAFHDITNGTNSEPCEISPSVSKNCIAVTSPAVVSGVTEGEIGTGTTAEYNATAGYNLATGLGTIDANNLVTDWSKITLASTAVTMTPSQTTFAHSTAITINGTVTGTASPTGNVALMTDSTEPLQQGQGVFPLTSGAYSSSVNYLPGGTYHIWTQYSGDANNGMSTSTPPVQITVSPETPGMDFNLFDSPLGKYYTPSSNPGTQVDYGSQLMLSAEVAPTSQLTNLQSCVISGTNCSTLSYTQPTGTVTFKDNSTTINTAVINAEGDAEYNAPFAVGAHSVIATYNGDQSYNTFTSSAIPFTVVKDQPDFFWGASNVNSNSQIISGQPTVFNVIVENNAQYTVCSTTQNTSTGACSSAPVPVLPPTGTVTLSSSPAGISGTITLSSGVDSSDGAQAGIGTVTLASGLGANTYNVTFTYSGDSNYLGYAATGQISVVAASGLASTTTATATGSVSPNSEITITGTVTGQSGHPAPTGGIIISSSGGGLNEIAVTAGTGTVSTFSTVLTSQTLFQGANFVTLQYTGDSTYAPSEFTLNSGNSIANPLSDFTLVPNTTIVPISTSGGVGTGTDTINVASVNGFTGTVNLSCAAALPISCSISPNPSLSGSSSATSTLTVNIPNGTANGNFNVAVTGKDSTGEFVHTLGITADVSGEVSTPTFALTSSGGITVVQNATTGNTSTMNVTPANAFTGTVALSCAVTTAPPSATSPITCAIPASVSVTSTSSVPATLTANSTATTTAGAYVITVTATSGGITQTAAVSVTVTSAAPATFALSNSGGISVTPGATSGNTSTISVTPSGGFNSTVTLTCAITPTAANDPATCSLSPSSLSNFSGTTAQTSTLTVSTTAAVADLIYPKFGNGKGWLGAGGGAILALLVFFGIPARRRSWRSMLCVLVAMVALGVMSSCGGGGSTSSGSGGTTPSNPGTSAGPYTVTVTGAATGVTPSPTTTVTLTVQ